MARSSVADPIGASETILGWISRYGLPSVFAVIMLGYAIWLNVQIVTSMQTTITAIAASQRELAESQRQMAKTLDAINQALMAQRASMVPGR